MHYVQKTKKMEAWPWRKFQEKYCKKERKEDIPSRKGFAF
jgi:hypothetical protein